MRAEETDFDRAGLNVIAERGNFIKIFFGACTVRNFVWGPRLHISKSAVPA
jgi:hypothetical protein